MENIYTNELRKLVAEFPNRSAWKKGVKEYADELLNNLEEKSQLNGRLPKDEKELKEWLLNGATDCKDYSYTYCSLKYDSQIAKRLCTPSEFKRKDGGRIAPSRHDNWFNEQAKALNYACSRIKSKFKLLEKPQIDLKGGGGII